MAVEAVLRRLLAGRDGDQAGFEPRGAIPGELQGAGDLDQADDVLGGDVVADVVAGPDDDPVAGLRDAALVPGLLRGPGARLRGRTGAGRPRPRRTRTPMTNRPKTERRAMD